jgi:hypothetical protein
MLYYNQDKRTITLKNEKGFDIMEKKNVSGGMSFSSVLALIFIVLKLCGVINWSWVWVLSPIWITFIIGLIAIGVIYLITR